MKVLYLTCATSSSVDATTNRLSLFHLLEEISARTFPTKLPSFCVATLFERELDDEISEPYVISIELGGKLLLSAPNRADFSRTPRVRNVTTINELTLPSAGGLVVSVLRKSVVLASWLVHVRQGGRAAASAVAAAPPPAEPLPAKRSVN